MSHAAAQPDSPDASGHHDPNLAHHFDSLGRQYASAKTGMWVFLATEILMFGGLFCAYAVYRSNHPEIFDIGHVFLDSNLGAINTVVLLLSSFTMAWAVRAAQTNQKRLTVVLLSLTLLGGFGFMGIKYVEYAHKIHLGIAPGSLWDPAADGHAEGQAAPAVEAEAAPAAEPVAAAAPAETPAPAAESDHSQIAPAATGPAGLAQPAPVEHEAIDPYHMSGEQFDKAYMFFGIYYLMTGLHGVHVLVGMGLLTWLIIRAARGEFSDRYFTPVDLGGLYWHLVDLVWIFLFPLLYLIH
jgi:cytochrome c oxidase subunit 3